MPLREALQAAARVMRSGSPGLERMFDQVDSRWLEHHGIVRQAFKGSLQYHGLFGEVVLRSPAVSSKIPYSDSLRKASEKILIRDLTDYHIEWTTSEQDAGFRSNTRWEFTGQTFQNGVANWLKSNLGESLSTIWPTGNGPTLWSMCRCSTTIPWKRTTHSGRTLRPRWRHPRARQSTSPCFTPSSISCCGRTPAGASALSHPNAWLSWKRRCMTPS